MTHVAVVERQQDGIWQGYLEYEVKGEWKQQFIRCGTLEAVLKGAMTFGVFKVLAILDANNPKVYGVQTCGDGMFISSRYRGDLESYNKSAGKDVLIVEEFAREAGFGMVMFSL